ncbi:unnamed protein product [Paramecium sonneborni]|uniref:Protein kinase domain-containing protein n=1 Tax=Paramecium sonneborni TaxID=65129 RepID=A0A8S1RHP9_9CILI|nr:unnamed protein product [Paramecium sonneborni]
MNKFQVNCKQIYSFNNCYNFLLDSKSEKLIENLQQEEQKIREILKNEEQSENWKQMNMYWNNNPEEEFEFLEIIGEGAYANVYKGRNKENGQIVAIKIIAMVDEVENFSIGNKDFESKICLTRMVSILTQSLF